MIYPTRTAVLIAAAGAPVGLAVAAAAPGRWMIALAWPLAVVLLCVIDALRSVGPATAAAELPQRAGVGEEREAVVSVAVDRRRPAFAEVAVDGSPLVELGNPSPRIAASL